MNVSGCLVIVLDVAHQKSNWSSFVIPHREAGFREMLEPESGEHG
nr:hypothetical protein [Pontimonas salivibrio]